MNMSAAFAAGSVPASLPAATPEQRAHVQKTAKSFEASFLSTMLGQMFEGTEAQAPFGGGQGETAFRSFMMDAMGKSMVERGGIGLAQSVAQEMLKMQGLS
jgi:flagellar protein FlgJ